MDKIWVCVTGASGLLGRKIALCFASSGFNIVLHGRDKKRLDKVADEVKDYGVDYRLVYGDFLFSSNVDKLCDVCKNVGVSVLVNNAGILCYDKNFIDIEDSELKDMMQINLIVPMLLVKKLICQLDIVININSKCGVVPSFKCVPYSVSKYGFRGFSVALKMEYYNLSVFDVFPEYVNGDYSMIVNNVSEYYNSKVWVLNLYGR